MPPLRIILIAGSAASGKTTLLHQLRDGSCPQLARQLEMGSVNEWHYVELRDVIRLNLTKTQHQMVVHCDLYNQNILDRIQTVIRAADQVHALTLCTSQATLIARNSERLRKEIPRLFKPKTHPQALQKIRACIKRQKRNKNKTELQGLYHRWFDFLEENQTPTYWINSSAMDNPTAHPIKDNRTTAMQGLQGHTPRPLFPTLGKQIRNFSNPWKI